MRSIFSVNCMMCGRSSGLLRGGVFFRAPGAPPLELRSGRSRCGFCSGNLYLEPDDSIATAASLDASLEKRRQLASWRVDHPGGTQRVRGPSGSAIQAPLQWGDLEVAMTTRDALERRAVELAVRLSDELVESSEQVDSRMGTYLLTALAAELGQRVQRRCWDQARSSSANWDVAGAEAETLITAAWRCMETISVLSNHFKESDEASLPGWSSRP
jgi:hypothetical protein